MNSPCAHHAKNVSWSPGKQRGLKEYEHMHSIFEKTGQRSSDFIIAPDWESENSDPTHPFQRRRYRPWAFEFSGARYWPCGSAEAKGRSRKVQNGQQANAQEMGEEQEVYEVPIATAGQCPEWQQEVAAISAPGGQDGYNRTTRIPPSFENLWQPRRISSFGNPATTYPDPRSARAQTSRSRPQYHMYSEDFQMSNLKPASAPVKLPYLNFANSQWMSKFPVD